jgi:Ca2+-binding EF-hand superfamily protein
MTLQKKIVLSMAVLGLVATQALAEGVAPKEGGKSDAQASFEVLDANRDGGISKDEAAGMKGLSESFGTLDANKDGKLDLKEFSKAVAK